MLREATGKRTVIEGLRQLGSGDLDYKVDTTELKGNNKELAEVVNSMGDGLKTAVEVRMKNERMQADLITNVSHDIKTPLTSIVNYVDLLKRENIEDPKIKGYIDILERKSQRLKQLTEDLVEASKASSGNVNMEFVTLNLNELVQQVNGEFDERLSGRELDMICSLPPEPALVRVDSRYLWRVIENLYGNVAKYAMPGSRVYAVSYTHLAAYLNRVPYVVLRAISDKADDSATVDYPTFERQAIRHCVNLVLNMVKRL